MAGFDLTDFASNSQPVQKTPSGKPFRVMKPVSSHGNEVVPEEEKIYENDPETPDQELEVDGRKVKNRGSVSRQELAENHWTPDKFVADGQTHAGEEDAAHKEFLKNTEWVD